MVTPSNIQRVDQLLDDLSRLLSRHCGAGLGVGTLGVRVLGLLNCARRDVGSAVTQWEVQKNALKTQEA